MKVFRINKDLVAEVKEWCSDNLGKEDLRWWTSPAGSTWNGKTAMFERDINLFIDVTEEEESNLTYFILRYEQ